MKKAYTTSNLQIEISPNKHHENKYNIVVNDVCYSRSGDFAEQLAKTLISLLAVGDIQVDYLVPGPRDETKTVTDNENDIKIKRIDAITRERDELQHMLDLWNANALDHTPKTPKRVYEMRLNAICEYLDTLDIETAIEGTAVR